MDNKRYVDQIHQLGRIGTIGAIIVLVAIPWGIAFVFDLLPLNVQQLQIIGNIALIFAPITISLVINYAPIFGSGTYVALITGNVNSTKLPVAIHALNVSNTELFTEEGDVVITIGLAISSMMTIIVLSFGLLFFIPLKPFLEHPVVTTSTRFLLPALMGSLILLVFQKDFGKQRIENGFFSLIPCLIGTTILKFTHHWKTNLQGIYIMLFIPITIFTALALYKRNIIKVNNM